MRQGDTFSTPCFKAAPNVFVAKRSHYSSHPECSPLPDMFGDFVDEDTWTKMNKGFIADLDSIHMTPLRKVQSFPISEVIHNLTFLARCNLKCYVVVSYLPFSNY